MKKTLSVVLLIVLVLLLGYVAFRRMAPASSPAQTAPEETAAPVQTPAAKPAPTPAPTPTPEPTPVWEPGKVTAGELGILYRLSRRGETGEVLEEDGNWLLIRLDGMDLLVDRRFVKDADEPLPEEKTLYALTGAKLFSNPYLSGEPEATLKLNTPLTLMEEMDGLMLVKTEDLQAYVAPDQVSSARVTWSGGGGGGSSGGSDGGDISLGRPGFLRPVAGMFPVHREAESASLVSKSGRITVDGAELYLKIVTAGDSVMVTKKEESSCTVWTGEELGTLPRWALELEGDEPFTPWTGYAKNGAKLYGDHWMGGPGTGLKMNTPVTVLLPTGYGFFVEVDGRQGYMQADQISEKQIVWTGGGGSSGGSGEWTAPVL